MKRIDYLFDGFSIMCGIVQTERIFQIIMLVIGIISSIVSVLYSFYHWYMEAKADGKITKEEIKEGTDILINGGKEIKEQIKKGEKKK